MIYLYALIFGFYNSSNLIINCSDYEIIRTEVMSDEDISIIDKNNILNVLEAKREKLNESGEFCLDKPQRSI